MTDPAQIRTPTWRTRLDEARQRMVFEPTPSGARPHVHKLEYLSELLETVESAGHASAPDTPTKMMCLVLSTLLREQINARLYAENMRNRLECGPDRIDEVHEKLDLIAVAVREVMKQAAGLTTNGK